MIVEVIDRNPTRYEWCADEKAAVKRANDLLIEHIKDIGYEDVLNDLEQYYDEVELAKSAGLWARCNLGGYNYDCYILTF